MASPRFAECESGSTVLSHHKALATTMGWKQHENGCSRSSTKPPRSFFCGRPVLSLLVAILSWSSLIVAVSASEPHGDRSAPLLVADDLAWKGSSLLLDQRPPPILPLELMPPHLSNEDASKTLDAPPSKRSVTTDPKAGSSNFTIPKPFDTGLSNNFTTSCGSFLTRLRTNDAFNNCHPFSLMLQTSSSFFDASKSYLRITQTLDATCGVNPTSCKTLLDNYARELLSASACKTDYANDNPLVIQAYNGLVAYQPAYLASCTRDDDGRYCFANAVSNTSAIKDSLPYYLPVGQELPGGSRLTCNGCLQQVMSMYAPFSNNVTQPLSKTYATAAQQISIACGKTFVNVTAAPLKGAAVTSSPSFTPTITLFLMIIFSIFH